MAERQKHSLRIRIDNKTGMLELLVVPDDIDIIVNYVVRSMSPLITANKARKALLAGKVTLTNLPVRVVKSEG